MLISICIRRTQCVWMILVLTSNIRSICGGVSRVFGRLFKIWTYLGSLMTAIDKIAAQESLWSEMFWKGIFSSECAVAAFAAMMPFFLCSKLCLLRSLARVKLFAQSAHSYGRWLSWVRRWSAKIERRVKPFKQSRQGHGNFPEARLLPYHTMLAWLEMIWLLDVQ